MRIHQLRVPEGYQWLIPGDDDAADALRDACGARQGASWTPAAFTLLTTEDDGSPMAFADCPWIGRHVLALRDKARRLVEPLLGGDGEFLALANDEDDFRAFNTLRTLDVLDEQHSTIAYGRRSGAILNIENYAFRDGVLPRRAAFRLPQERLGTFFTEELAEDMLALDLAGLRLEPVGDAEPAQ